MASLTRDRNTPEISGDFVVLLMAPVRIFGGGIVCVDAGGLAVPGGHLAAVRAIGRAEESVDNRLGVPAAISVKVRRGIFKWDNSATLPVTPADLHQQCYVQDDQTVRAYDAAPDAVNIPAGRVVRVDADGIFVDSRAAEAAAGVTEIGADIAVVAIQGETNKYAATVQLLRGGAPLAESRLCRVWISTDEGGAVCRNADHQTLGMAIGSAGVFVDDTQINVGTGAQISLVASDGSGAFILEIIANETQAFYLNVSVGGRIFSSAAMAFEAQT